MIAHNSAHAAGPYTERVVASLVLAPRRGLEHRARRLPVEEQRAARAARARHAGERLRRAIALRENRPLVQPEHESPARGSVEPHAAARYLRHHHALVAPFRAP